MTTSQIEAVESAMGLLAQMSTALLVAILLLLLRRNHRGGAYFNYWCMAWVAISIALLALFLSVGAPVAGGMRPYMVTLSYSIYLSGKISFFLLLLAGTLRFARNVSKAVQRYLPPASTILLATAFLFPWYGPDLNRLVWVQAPIGWLCGLLCATLLWRQKHMQSFGTRYCTVMFMAMSTLWLLYFLAYTTVSDAATPVFVWLLHYNSFFDLVIQQLLAFGFVVIFMEQGHRKMDLMHVELMIAHEKLKDSANHDQLTGAGNRLALKTFSRAYHERCVLLACDLDGLKSINDHYGHEAGDRLLVHFVAVMNHGLRASDQLFRVGGDEFVLVMLGLDASTMLARVHTIVKQAPPAVWGQHQLRLSASFGAVDWPAGADFETLLQQADQLMYQEKSSKRTLP